jgi:glyceraldehyde-3-phosphate dehydrogenase (NAD(P))
MPNIVHIKGTGTIGEPLIGLFDDFKEPFGIDEITFHKRTPLIDERSKVNDLIRRGAALAVDEDRWTEFEELGHAPKYTAQEAIDRASVVIDCTPAGLANKEQYYESAKGPLGFLAQGSEFGFGKPYARGINDDVLDRDSDRFLHIVSCNTHNIASLVKTIAFDADGGDHLVSGRFLCMRRANDISQDGSFIAAPVVGVHDDDRFGTHHARDANALFETLDRNMPLWSSAVKIPTQYMHLIWFSLTLDREITVDEAIDRFQANTRVALTHKRSSNRIFSFGRDHGFYGRILSQTVIPVDTLATSGDNELVGFCFTPQDGNALLSSVTATLWYLHPGGFNERIDAIRPYLFQEI